LVVSQLKVNTFKWQVFKIEALQEDMWLLDSE